MTLAVSDCSGYGGDCRRWGGRIIPDLPTGTGAPAVGSGLAPSGCMGSHATVALGISGDNLACDTLTRQGYAVLARRYRTRVGEIDIVARDGETLVFVEVKTRTSEDFGIPADSVTWRKQRRIATMARWYLAEKRLHGCLCRFDVVTVMCRPGLVPEIEVVKDAFQVS